MRINNIGKTALAGALAALLVSSCAGRRHDNGHGEGRQAVDSVTIQRRTHFLMDRQAYSRQLQHYLEAQKKGQHLVTSICFGNKKKKMERRYLAIHKRYSKRNDLRITLIDQSQFRFHAEEYIEQATVETVQKAMKAKKKKKK